jgi:hypothetical protein
MENTQQFNHPRVNPEKGELRRWSADSHTDINKYVVPLWLQEVSQILSAENKQKIVLSSS